MSSEAVVVCGSLSLHPVSLGAAMHGAGYVELGLPWVYIPFAMTSERLRGALTGMRALGIRGFGVSMPFKQEVLALLDAVDDLAMRIGAVNTIVNDGGRLTGFNTDAEGATRALEEARVALGGARVLVLGGGGAARAVAFGLAGKGAAVTVANRTASKATAIASNVGARTVPWEEALARAASFDVVVNASSAGMDQSRGGGGASAASGAEDDPLAGLTLRAGMVLMDIVYRPIWTKLLGRAGDAGATTIHGGRMLLHQAARQFELYTGRAAPLDAMNQALERAIGVETKAR